MRRQQESWRTAEEYLLEQDKVFIHRWENVSQAIDFRKTIKTCYRNKLTWLSHNIIRKKDSLDSDITDEFIVNIINEIIDMHESSIN